LAAQSAGTGVPKRDHALLHGIALTRDDLKTVAVEALKRLKECPEILRGFFADPKLSYIRD
jgi:hypothetical protein